LPTSSQVLPALPFAEAVAFFRAKGKRLEPTFAWQDFKHEDHSTAFTVAKSTGFDILNDLQQSLADSLANGTLEKDWQRQIIPILQAKGWWGRQAMEDPLTGETKMVQLGSLRRLHVIFDTNLRTANAAGRWAQIARSADLAPFLRYSAVLDSRTRPLHREWNGTVLRWDHPWWNTHFPPNGWFCRCTVTQMSNLDLKRFGLTESDAPPADPTPARRYVNPRTGEVSEVPAGIDPGFAYNPGRAPPAPAPSAPNTPPSGGAPALDVPAGQPPAATAPSAPVTPPPGEISVSNAPELKPPEVAVPARLTPKGAITVDGIPERAARTAVSKWVDAPPALTAAAQAGAAEMLPALTRDFGGWVSDIFATGHTIGNRRVVGALPQDVLDFLASKDVMPGSGAITVSDEELAHFRNERHVMGTPRKGPNAVSVEDLQRLPELLSEPDAILWGRVDGKLLYVFTPSDDPRAGKFVVEINWSRKKTLGQPLTNAVIHASLVPTRELRNSGMYEVVMGEIP
jgi:SPP1 gp7 family putative phage head morphogenesis protein